MMNDYTNDPIWKEVTKNWVSDGEKIKNELKEQNKIIHDNLTNAREIINFQCKNLSTLTKSLNTVQLEVFDLDENSREFYEKCNQLSLCMYQMQETIKFLRAMDEGFKQFSSTDIGSKAADHYEKELTKFRQSKKVTPGYS